MKKINLLKLILISLIGIIFSGCGDKVPQPIKVPQKCITPITECNKFKHTSKSIEGDLLKCIKEYKKNSQVCQ